MEFEMRREEREVDIVIGNTSVKLGENQHKWKLFVETYDEAIKKVEIFLHPTFNPNHFTLTKEPFVLESVGWGEFEIKLKVHFVDGQMKDYTHDLSFDDKPSMKSYTIKVDKLPPPMIEQLPIDHPSLLPALERKAHELKMEKRSSQVSSKEESEQKKAREYTSVIDFSYSFYQVKPTKGNPTRKEELTIKNSLLKYDSYHALCGDKRGRETIFKALEPEKQRNILEFVKRTLENLPHDVSDDDGEEKRKRRGRAKISFSFSQPNVMGGGFVSMLRGFVVDRENLEKDGVAHKKILEVLEFVKKREVD